MSRITQILAQALLLTGFLAWVTNDVPGGMQETLTLNTRHNGIEIKKVEPVCVSRTRAAQKEGSAKGEYYLRVPKMLACLRAPAQAPPCSAVSRQACQQCLTKLVLHAVPCCSA